MNSLQFTHHATQRLHQRGIPYQCLNLVEEFGEWVEDGVVMTQRALKTARAALRAQGRRDALQALDHLRNVTLIEQQGVLVTAFRADRKRLRRLRAGHIETVQ